MGPSDHARHRHSLTHDYSGVEETRTPVLMARRATPGKSGDDHMSATAPKLVIRRPRALPAILRAGLLAGVLDITAAIVVYAHVTRTVPMLQGIASGLLGRDAFTGGLLTAGLGLLCHFCIATSAAAVYFLASRRLPFLLRHAVVSGEAYGVVVYFFMQVVVIPAALALGSLMCADQRRRDDAVADPRAARQAIERANADWLDAMKREDADAIAAPYDDAGVFVTATGRSVVGPLAIAALMRERFAQEGRVVDGDIVQDGLTQVGSQIYEWGHVDLRLQRGAERPTQVKGRYLTVWNQDADGRWKILRNLSLPF